MAEGKSTWLSRLRARSTRGDVVVANIGAGARDVIVGKNILRIGTLVVPAAPVFVGVVALIALAALGAYWRFVPDKMPPSLFNVAVAQFGEIGADGRVSATANSQMFSQYIFKSLRDEVVPQSANLPGLLKPNVWHDSLFPTQMRVRIDLVPGNTPDARRAAAKQFAESIGAKMIIYGNLAANENSAAFVPEFYVAQLNDEETAEIIGQYQFGAPIPVQLANDLGANWADSLPLNKTLSARQQALAQFTLGLTHDLSGYHEDAIGFFQNALRALQDSKSRQGEEIVFYFLGRQYLLLANNQQAEMESLNRQAGQARSDAERNALRDKAQQASAQVDADLAKAEEQFAHSRERAADYARAHSGLASVARLRALRQSPQQRLDQPEFLNRAFAEYQIALNAAIQAGEEQTPLQVRIALGTTYFLQGEAWLHKQDWGRAAAVFDESIKTTEGQLSNLAKRYRSLAEAYLTLGNANFEKGIAQAQSKENAAARMSYQKALDWYGKCIEIKNFDATTAETSAARCALYQSDVKKRMQE